MVFLVRLFKRLGLVLLALVLLYAIGRPIQIWLDSFYSGARGPYLQMLSSNAVTLRWQSENEFIGVVHYGNKPDEFDQIQMENVAGEEHEIRLTGLKANTKYFYSIGNKTMSEARGKDYWFKTAPVAGVAINNATPVRFWVTGDQGYPNVIQSQVRDAALNWAKQHPRTANNNAIFDLWMTTGDNAYSSGSNPQFQAGFFEPYKRILRNTPVWPGYGNHDSRRWVFFDLFTFPTKGESGGIASGSEHYYSFDYANIHVVMLDTQESDLDIDGEMLRWLKNDLQHTQQQWLLAFFHHPPYTKGSHDSDNKRDSRGRLIKVRENILPLLENAGVDLVISGHSHMYERSALINCHYGFSDTFDPGFIRDNAETSVYQKKASHLSGYNGTVYSVIGSSSKVDNGPLNHPAMPYSFKDAGSMVIDVNQNHLKAYFISNTSEVKDHFEIIKGIEQGVKSERCK